MNESTIMSSFAGRSVQVSSWVVTGFLKKCTGYLIGKKSDGKFVFVFENPLTGSGIDMAIDAHNIDNLTLASSPNFTFQDAVDEFGDLCDQVFSVAVASAGSPAASVPTPPPSFATSKRKVSADECNTTCIKCGAPAYRGFSSIECSSCDG